MTNTNSRDDESPSSISVEDLLADIKRIKAEIGTPPPQVRFSNHMPSFVEARPTAQPHTDDMREMCSNLGPQRTPGGYWITTQFGDMVVLNPVYQPKGQTND